jgi:hypothetical protein
MVGPKDVLAVQNLDNRTFFHDRMRRYAEIISAKCGIVNTVWGFIDDTVQKTCRQTYHQNECTVVTNKHTARNCSRLSRLMDFLHVCLLAL